MNLKEATDAATVIARAIAPVCAEHMIVGDIRRKATNVEWIGIVLVSLTSDVQYSLFGEQSATVQLIEPMIAELRERKFFRSNPKGENNGMPCIHLLFAGFPVRLYPAMRADYGRRVALHTGDAAFARMLKTPRANGGLLPGFLEHGPDSIYRKKDGAKLPIDCRSEEEFFRVMQLDFVSPEERNLETARELLRKSLRVR